MIKWTTDLINDYRQWIRSPSEEEPMDLVIYRPLAYLVVKATYHLPLNPNHYSLMAMFCAVTGGLLLAIKGMSAFTLSALFLVAFNVLDCCDGMIARVKKNGTANGEYIDMFVDIVSNTVYYVGLLIAVYPHSEIQAVGVFFSGIFLSRHASVYNFYKKYLTALMKNDPNFMHKEVASIQEIISDYQKKGVFNLDRFWKQFYLLITPLKTMNFEKLGKDLSQHKRKMIQVGFLAGSTHLTVLPMALLLGNLNVYFVYALILGNIYHIAIALDDKTKRFTPGAIV